MLILFDHGTPAPLLSFLKDHSVKKTKDLGWDTLSNGELLSVAEEARFEIFLTTDKNIRYQQNLAERKIAIVVLGNGRSYNGMSAASLPRRARQDRAPIRKLRFRIDEIRRPRPFQGRFKGGAKGRHCRGWQRRRHGSPQVVFPTRPGLLIVHSIVIQY